MKASTEAICTAILKPRAWEMEGRNGTTYKVSISDGESNITMQCLNEEVWSNFEVFKPHMIVIDLVQTNYEGRTGVKALIVEAYKDE